MSAVHNCLSGPTARSLRHANAQRTSSPLLAFAGGFEVLVAVADMGRSLAASPRTRKPRPNPRAVLTIAPARHGAPRPANASATEPIPDQQAIPDPTGRWSVTAGHGDHVVETEHKPGGLRLGMLLDEGHEVLAEQDPPFGGQESISLAQDVTSSADQKVRCCLRVLKRQSQPIGMNGVELRSDIFQQAAKVVGVSPASRRRAGGCWRWKIRTVTLPIAGINSRAPTTLARSGLRW